jgi:hypothetical protein
MRHLNSYFLEFFHCVYFNVIHYLSETRSAPSSGLFLPQLSLNDHHLFTPYSKLNPNERHLSKCNILQHQCRRYGYESTQNTYLTTMTIFALTQQQRCTHFFRNCSEHGLGWGRGRLLCYQTLWAFKNQ